MLLAVGVLAALVEARVTGRGRVVDAAMVDGAGLLMAHTLGLRASGMWPGPRGSNVLDGGAHFYRCYRCADDRWVAVGAIETRFYQALLDGLGLSAAELHDQWNRDRWPAFATLLEHTFVTRPRDEWLSRFDGTDACVTPVLDWDELASHPHLRTRGTFTDAGDGPVPAPAPRFSPGPRATGSPEPRDVLGQFGLDR
jgi:alpha-methylacyl-CoA racemase